MGKFNIDIENEIADTIMEKPQCFKVGTRQFRFYPITLGKSYLQARLIELLEIDQETLHKYSYLEILNVTQKHKEIVARIIVIHTCRTKKECFDEDKVQSLIKFFVKLQCSQLASLLMICLKQPDVNKIKEYIGLDKEAKRQAKVSQCKKNTNTYVFNGKSIWGTLIDFCCERYGWTMDYVIWGIALANIQMLMADKVVDICLTDEEKKRCPVSPYGEKEVDGNNKEQMMQLIKSSSWE